MRKQLLIIVMLIVPVFAPSQETLILKDSSKIKCHITKIDDLNIYIDIEKDARKVHTLINKNEVATICHNKRSDINWTLDYFSHMNSSIKDSTISSVSKFGDYFSIGLGPSYEKGSTGFCGVLSNSFAYKSYIFTFTLCSSGTGEQTTSSSGSWTNYQGFLIGKALRWERSMISLSVGVASSDIQVYVPPVTTNNGVMSPVIQDGINYDRDGISFPIELKCFALTYNGIGIGAFFSYNIAPKYSPFIAAIALNFGFWNNTRF